MLSSLFVFFMSLAISFLIFFFTFVLSFRVGGVREKMSPFECGFDPKNSARVPFSLRFFLLAVIFLIFDVEIALLLPSPFAVYCSPNYLLLSSTLFLIIILLGLFHEWREGSLNWK